MPLSSSIESQPFLNIDHRDRRVFSLPSLFEIREDKEKRKEKREKRKEKREKKDFFMSGAKEATPLVLKAPAKRTRA
ncbi:MAG: hypothetical protein ACPG7B_03135 [Pseudomonadales bacterium]